MTSTPTQVSSTRSHFPKYAGRGGYDRTPTPTQPSLRTFHPQASRHLTGSTLWTNACAWFTRLAAGTFGWSQPQTKQHPAHLDPITQRNDNSDEISIETLPDSQSFRFAESADVYSRNNDPRTRKIDKLVHSMVNQAYLMLRLGDLTELDAIDSDILFEIKIKMDHINKKRAHGTYKLPYYLLDKYLAVYEELQRLFS